MKRSEMLGILEDTIEDYLGEKINNPDVLAEVILKDIEAVGMIPPNQYACTNEFRFEWEDEDEA